MRRNFRLIVLGLVCFLSVATVSERIEERSVISFTEQLHGNQRQQYSSYLLPRLRRTAGTRVGPRLTVGACKLDEFLYWLQNCTQDFYLSVRVKEPSWNNCSAAYVKLKTCMQNTLCQCLENSMLKRMFLLNDDVSEMKENFLALVGNEEFWCEKGGIGVSNDYLPSGAKCDLVFYDVTEDCTLKYHKLFNTSSSDNKLCSEYEKAKKCYLKAVVRHCSFNRMFQRMVEVFVEIAGDFQPFCNRSSVHGKLTFENLIRGKNCPPYSLADVAFVLDVANETKSEHFTAMKNMVEAVLKTMDYGLGGIQASMFHFDADVRTIFKLGEFVTKDELQREIRKMERTTTQGTGKAPRMTGKLLSDFARKNFSQYKGYDRQKKTTSGRRSYSTAVVFVMTTGPSADSMVRGLKLLQERNVHIVFIGPPSLKVPVASNKFFQLGAVVKAPTEENGSLDAVRVIRTDFKPDEVENVAQELASEICKADKKKQPVGSGTPVEESTSHSKWQHIKNILSRSGRYDLLLHFESKTVAPPTTQKTFFSAQPWFGSSFNPAEEGMDGDIFFG